jgi:hypothetical protein
MKVQFGHQTRTSTPAAGTSPSSLGLLLFLMVRFPRRAWLLRDTSTNMTILPSFQNNTHSKLSKIGYRASSRLG